MKTDEESHAEAIAFRAHPPERLVRSLARGHIAGACCCCCCCCCLHSLGGVTGAILGSYYPPPPLGKKDMPAAKLLDDELDGPVSAAPAQSSVTPMYWLSTLAVAILVSVVTVAVKGPDGIPIALAILFMAFPFVQLGGSLLCALAIAGRPDLQQEADAWKRLGWITVGAVVGGLLGFLVMYLPVALHR